MDRKSLPLSNRPSIHYDPNVDVLLEMLGPYPDLYEKEISEHFIDTIVYNDKSSSNIAFYRIVDNIGQDCLVLFDLPYELARISIGDICEYVIQLLDRDYYVTFLWDTFWITNYTTHLKNHIEHPALIYGYDRRKQIFFVQDYFDFFTWGRQEVTFADVRTSYTRGERPFYPGHYAMLYAHILYCKKIGNPLAPPPNLQLIRQKLQNFLMNHSYSTLEGACFGIQFLDILGKRYQANPEYISLKHCHFIVVHMQLMLCRLKVLQKHQPHNSQQYAVLIAQLNDLLTDVRKTEMRILKSQIASRYLSMDYAARLKDIKSRYAAIIGTMIDII